MTSISFALLFTWAGLLACKGSDGTDTGDIQPDPDPACVEDVECAAYQFCNEGGFCEDGDNDNDKEGATGILWEDPEDGWLNSSDDEDWYSFSSEGGEWARLQTICAESDTRVDLYSPSGKLHAGEDNHPLGSVSTYDTVMMAYLSEPGEWLVKVSPGPEHGGPATYELELLPFGAVSTDDDMDEPSLDITLSNSNINNFGVLLEEDGDADWFRYTVTPGAAMYIAGSADSRDSDLTPVVEMMLPDGTPLFYKESPTGLDRGVHFRIEASEILLKVSDVDGKGGANSWATLHSYEVSWYEQDQVEEEPNDSSGEETALPVTMDKDDEGRDRGTSRGLGVLDSDGDVDRFAIDIIDGNSLYINGTADAYGSLLSDSVVRVLDDQGSVIAEGEVDTEQDLFADVAYVGPLVAGTYTIEVRSESAIGGPGSYYRFTAFQKNFDD